MLRVISSIYLENQTLELLVNYRRDVLKLFRTYATSSPYQTVLMNEDSKVRRDARVPPQPPPPSQPPPQPPQPPRRAWTFAAAVAFTVSVGGMYFYKRLSDDEKKNTEEKKAVTESKTADKPTVPYPADGGQFPEQVTFLVVGAGTAAFAAMRALRAARPDAQVLLVGEEMAVPYMRSPLSKEVWREPALSGGGEVEADRQDRGAEETLTFRQWNGRRRALAYEPLAFYTPVEELGRGLVAGGVACARGWRVRRLDVERHQAELVAAGGRSATVRYQRCLLATGPAPHSTSGSNERVYRVHRLEDARRLAAALERGEAQAGPRPLRVAVLGGGLLACELAASLAQRCKERGTRTQIVQIHRGGTPLEGILPAYLGVEVSEALRRAGVEVVRGEEDSERGVAEVADLVVDCASQGHAPDLATPSGLETHDTLGGIVVNPELQARDGVYAAGDAACYYDVVESVRRRVQWHDHAVASGRRAGENMAGERARPYTHRPMLWSDLHDVAVEAVGHVDATLRTVAVFLDEARGGAAVVTDSAMPPAERLNQETTVGPVTGTSVEMTESTPLRARARRFERGVVFYLRGERVVGVLLWNLFNRVQLARQVLAQGEFQDLFEVAKLFTIHDQD
ncbi:hypothetical protein ACJJTC_015134 [Scirpophaga incertulas]